MMLVQRLKKLIIVLLLMSYPLMNMASAFDECPTEAFLIQGKTATIYGVNLATGYYQELATDMGTSQGVNAVGFNFYDNYIYGFGYEHNTLVRIGADFQIEPLVVSGLPNTTFYVGDVALMQNSYYMYRNGGDNGLYRIDLEETSEHYLETVRIVSGNELNLKIYDFAFHPDNGFLYSVDGNGDLWQINPESGDAEKLSNVGQRGTFGAVYFDVTGRFYISRNNDGRIFRIDVSANKPKAEFFAFGPSSGYNDGARCAVAPILTEAATVDFGDAPKSYGISIEDNGARHELSADLYLGQRAGGKDDGVDFITGFEKGLDTLVNIKATGQGYINAWVDWNQNGTFDGNEQAIINQQMDDGDNRLLLAVPDSAQEGITWGRIRYSSTQNIGPTGGVSDGEVEDHQIVVTASGITIVSYPGHNSFVTLAYEDNWPRLGDYDMNDVVVAYRTRRYINQDEQVIRYDIEGRILASGAGYHNGFAIQLDDIPSTNVNEALIRYEINGETPLLSAFEDNGHDDAVLVITDDIWSYINHQENCQFYRTEMGCDQQQDLKFFVSVPLINPVNREDAPEDLLNPFIFAAPGRYHGDDLGHHPGRSLEIHLKNKKSQFFAF